MRSFSSRYADPRASAYHDTDFDFSKGSFGPRPRAIQVVSPPSSHTVVYQSPPPASASHRYDSTSTPPRSEVKNTRYQDIEPQGFKPEHNSRDYEQEHRAQVVEAEHENNHQDQPAETESDAQAFAGAFIAWTGGVQYQNPENAVVEPISNEELLEGLAEMRLQREKKRAELGLSPGGPRSPLSPTGPGGQRDNGYGNRNVSGRSGGDNDDAWGQGGGGGDQGWGNGGGDDSWGGGGGGGQARGNGCFNCGQERHRSAECTEPRKARGGDECYNCSQVGHRSADCTEERKPRGGGTSECYNRGETGHFSRECPNEAKPRGRACYNCGQEGHESRECDQPRVEGAFRGSCYNCGEQGHSSRECSKDRVFGSFRGECHNCGKQGHQSRECPEPRGGGGGGYDQNNNNGGSWGNPAEAQGSSGDDWGAPADTPQTPALQESSGTDGWDSTPVEAVPATPNTGNESHNGWGQSPSENHYQTPVDTPSAPPARAPMGMHPDRLKMLGGYGAGAPSPARQQVSRDRPPHMQDSGYKQSQPQARPPPVEPAAPAPPDTDNGFGGW